MSESGVKQYRLRWEIGIFLLSCIAVWAVGISRSNLEVAIYKFMIFCPAVAFVHLSRCAIFYYINLSDVICGADGWSEKPPAVRAAVIGGVFAYYTILVYALTQTV